MVTADEVLNAKFRSTKFRDGYDQDAVDDFLDRVVATLRTRAGGAPVDRLLTAADVDAQRFRATRFREGYDPADVDALLARVRAELASAPSVAPRAAAPASAADGVDGPVPGIAEAEGFWRKLFGG